MISWSGAFACGIRQIDDQHKTLVNLVNDMFNHVSGNEEEEQKYLRAVLKEAAKYVKIHFATEEKIFIATRFSGYDEHKAVHDSFILVVTEQIRAFQDGKRISLYNLTNYLKDWVLTHIAAMDRQYFVYLRGLATRKADGKLTISKKDVMQKLSSKE